jgi:esterase/lipase superfamily enzyme
MPQYWLISDRDNGGTGTGRNVAGLSYFTSDGAGPLNDIKNWQKASPTQFRTLLAAAADQFPDIPNEQNEQQSHVTLLIHGYNNSFSDATNFYKHLCDSLYTGPESLGLCILYDWPSAGNLLGYLPDREQARQCADDLAGVLSNLYDWLLKKQKDAVTATQAALAGRQTNATPCKAKVSVIAHSMGNYILQKAMHSAWTRKNQPQLASLINQLLMIAADVDNDLFDVGAADSDDGKAIANLTYRITGLYSGRDAVLGASSGLKHFGTRRLGRSGLANRPPLIAAPPATDNVWDVDCSSFFPPNTGFNIPGIGAVDIHGAYFDTRFRTIELMRQLLRGLDRVVLDKLGVIKGDAWPA